jgi:hypothetical protein
MKRSFSSLVNQQPKSEVHRSMQLTAFSQLNPFDYKVKCEEFTGLKLACFHETSTKNAKALLFFLPDHGVSAKSFGSSFQ